MKRTCYKIKHLFPLAVLLSLIGTNAIAIRSDTLDREPQRFTSDRLQEQVDTLQSRSDKVASFCDIRQYGWCRDLSALDISIKDLRGQTSDPILESKRHFQLRERIDLVDKQMKGLEDRIRLAE